MKYLNYIVVLLTVFAVGCSNEEAPTALSDGTLPLSEGDPGVLFNFSNGPSNPGPIIVRFEVAPAALAFFDFDRELLMLVATDDGLGSCRAVTFTEPADAQQIQNPAGPLVELVQLRRGFGAVYDLSGGFPGFTCAFLTGPDMLAEGRVNVITTDNDFFASGTRNNTFRFKTNGKLQTPVNGTSVKLNSHFHAQINKDGIFRVIQDDIKLTPDPR